MLLIMKEQSSSSQLQETTMTINVKLRAALALAVVALTVTSLDLRSANAERATLVRAVKAPSVAELKRKPRVNILAERKILSFVERASLIGREDILRNSKREGILRNFKREEILRNLKRETLINEPTLLNDVKMVSKLKSTNLIEE
jgi:hypothetical protein